MRVMGLDVGSKTVGVACSDALLLTAQGIETIARRKDEAVLHRILELIKEYEVHTIVVGLPKQMDGSMGVQVDETKAFVALLEEVTDLPIVYEDERLTTKMAMRTLQAAEVHGRKKKKVVIDKMAATYILQSYLDRKSHGGI